MVKKKKTSMELTCLSATCIRALLMFVISYFMFEGEKQCYMDMYYCFGWFAGPLGYVGAKDTESASIRAEDGGSEEMIECLNHM